VPGEGGVPSSLQRHPELVSGSSWSRAREAEDWILKRVQDDRLSASEGSFSDVVADRPGHRHKRRMDRRSRLEFSLLERAGFRLRDYGGAAAVVGGAALLILAALAWRWTSGPETLEQGRIVRFGVSEGKTWQQPVVTVRTADGSIRQLAASRQALRNCRRGAAVTLIHRGSAIFVQGCAGD